MDEKEIIALQQALIESGYDIGSAGADGDWGSKSRDAYKEYRSKGGEQRYPYTSREDFESGVAAQAQELRQKFTAKDGRRYKEWEPEVSDYIDKVLFPEAGYNNPRSQTDLRGTGPLMNFLGKDQDFQTKKNQAKFKNLQGFGDHMGDAWSAATITKILGADPGFNGSSNHTKYIGGVMRGEQPGWESSALGEDWTGEIGDVLFAGRGEDGPKTYGDFETLAENEETGPSHGDAVTKVTTGPDGKPIYHFMGGNVGNRLGTKEMSRQEVLDFYVGSLGYRPEEEQTQRLVAQADQRMAPTVQQPATLRQGSVQDRVVRSEPVLNAAPKLSLDELRAIRSNQNRVVRR